MAGTGVNTIKPIDMVLSLVNLYRIILDYNMVNLLRSRVNCVPLDAALGCV